MLSKFVAILQRRLYAELEAKTSWGRNDLKTLIQTVIADSLLELME